MSVEKEFVPYEEALALKQLGFDQPCFAYWNADPSLSKPFLTFIKPFDHEWFIPTPLYSQAFRWFREKYDLPSNLELFHVGWDYVIYLNIIEKIDFNEGPWNTYEEAELACLRKLIEIVQGGNK